MGFPAKQKGCIYKITSPSGKAYIGQSRRIKGRLLEHARSHLKNPRYTCKALVGAIGKYGWNSMKVEILEDGLTAKQLDDRETVLIQEHGTHVHGYNIMSGGSICPWDNPDMAEHLRNVHRTEAYKQKQRDSWNQDRREAMRQSNKERNSKDGGKRIKEICALMRSRKTATTDAKMADTMRKKAAAALEVLEMTNPKLAAQKRRKAAKDRERNARNLEKKRAERSGAC